MSNDFVVILLLGVIGLGLIVAANPLLVRHDPMTLTNESIRCQQCLGGSTM